MTQPLSARIGRRITQWIEPYFPSLALNREVAMVKRAELAKRAGHYEGAGRTTRGSDFRVNRSDAIEAMRHDMHRLSWIGRDMLRNNPRVKRIRRQLVNNVVGAGIRPSVEMKTGTDAQKKQIEALIADHCLTTLWDADGLKSMLGQQGLGFGSVVIDGEILFRRRFRRPGDGYPLNFQVQMLEADFLNRDIDGTLPSGNRAVQGVEFDLMGRRVAYHLYVEHPGGSYGAMPATRRVTADNVIHLFEPERPGQVRGISWLAPVLTLLHELQKYQDGQVKRQEIAALFAGIVKTAETADQLEQSLGTLQAGSLIQIGSDESIDWTDPPSVDGYEPFMRVTDRVIAAGMGITYQGLTGDYSNVNYTSGRMGRMDVDPNIRDWQQNLMITTLCAGFARWIGEAVEDMTDIPRGAWRLNWTPPVRPVVDPTKDYKANETRIRSGQSSRRQALREQGYDPAHVEAEIAAERAWEAEQGLVLTSNAGASAPESETVIEVKKDDD